MAAEGIKLYGVSYDDAEALAAYVEASGVEFTLLSDVDSAVIRQYKVLNTIVQPEDVPFYGVPFPGFFLLDEDGVIVDKLFNRHFAHRDGVEAILDSYAGRVLPGASDPLTTASEDDGITVTAFLRGGAGILRAGPRRRLILRVAMPEGLHIYDDPVPDGMVATSITIDGPDGFRNEPAESKPTHLFELPGVSQPLQVWDGTVDFTMNVWADSVLGKIIADGAESIEVDVTIRYQACNNTECFIPRTRTLRLEIPTGLSTRPNFSRSRAIVGDVVDMDSATHMKRLIERQTAD